MTAHIEVAGDEVWKRALRLFEDGYTAQTRDDGMVEIANPLGMVFVVCLKRGTCTCKFFIGHEDRRACKHLLGLCVLLEKQAALSKLKIDHYKRFFGLWDDQGELVAVTVYRCGARFVAQRIASLSVCAACSIAKLNP